MREAEAVALKCNKNISQRASVLPDKDTQSFVVAS